MKNEKKRYNFYVFIFIKKVIFTLLNNKKFNNVLKYNFSKTLEIYFGIIFLFFFGRTIAKSGWSRVLTWFVTLWII